MAHMGSRSTSLQVLANQAVGPGYYRMRIACDPAFQSALPGQFVMIRLAGQALPLLRRPFSIHDLTLENAHVASFDILYKVIGPGTEGLSMSHAGNRVDVLGPLGRGFWTRREWRRIYMVAGGIGIAPFVFLAHYLVRQGVSPSQIQLFAGGRTSADLVCLDMFERLGVALRLTTDDGSAGIQCMVTHSLKEALQQESPDILYACGPSPMLREVMALSKTRGLPCQVSIEAMMACGMGACLGCAVEKSGADDAYLHACMDGPVFKAEEIVL